MEPGTRTAFLALSLFAIAWGSGCAHSGSTATTPPPKLFAVTAEWTPFYYYGPSQGGGPDKTIPRDTPVKLIRASFAFCKVQLLTGEQGYVARDDIGKAPTDVIDATMAPPKPITTASRLRAGSPEPRPDTPFEPLPEFEPTPIPPPSNLGN